MAERRVDLVIRKHAQRATDFRTGRRLGKDDHLVCLPKPPRPEWMSVAQYALLPHELALREVRVRIRQRRGRTKLTVVVSTLTDADKFSAADLA